MLRPKIQKDAPKQKKNPAHGQKIEGFQDFQDLGCPGFYVLLAWRFKCRFTPIPHTIPMIFHSFHIISIHFPFIFY